MRDDFSNVLGSGQHMSGNFSNRMGRADIWEVIFRTSRAGKQRNEFFNARVWLQEKEDE